MVVIDSKNKVAKDGERERERNKERERYVASLVYFKKYSLIFFEDLWET